MVSPTSSPIFGSSAKKIDEPLPLELNPKAPFDQELSPVLAKRRLPNHKVTEESNPLIKRLIERITSFEKPAMVAEANFGSKSPKPEHQYTPSSRAPLQVHVPETKD